MNILPFGQAVLAWRRSRGLTQEALARRAGIPRPNVSAIERGRREVSLTTLRTLAAALGVRPGLLVDGVSPEAARGGPLSSSRDTLERIADAVAFGRQAKEPRERAAIDALTVLLGPRMRAMHRQWRRSRIGRRIAMNAWRTLTSLYSRDAINTLTDRVTERQRTHALHGH